MASYYIGLSLLSNERQKPAARRKLVHDEGRRILSRLDGRPIEKLDIAAEKNGRPFFADNRADFNISHSANMAAVSYVEGETMRTGCDIELVRGRSSARQIAEKFFSVPERDYIFPPDKPGDEDTDIARFFQIWTLKECFLKLRGLSVFDMEAVPSFIRIDAEGAPRFAFCATAPSALSFWLYELSGAGERYVLASVAEGAGNPQLGLRPEIRWFSESSLFSKSIVEIKAEISPAETVSAKM